MRSLLERVSVTALLAVLLFGCAKSSPPPTVDTGAFDGAAPEIKQAWDQAVAAAATNDPGSAIATLRVLSRQEISMPQREALRKALVAYEAKLREAAKKGDAAAVKAMQDLGLSTTAPGK